jgi:hypothetical protein
VADTTDRLLGALDVSQVGPAEVRAVTAAGARPALPPPLLRRLSTRAPRFIAVDFFSLGGLMSAVDELNRVESVHAG